MAFKKPTVTKVKSDIQSLSIYIRTVKKFGKSTLFRDLIIEKFGDSKRGLLVGCGAEVGYNILDDLNATQVEEWDDLEELKEWLIETKGKEHNIEIIAFDVVGEIIPMAEDKIIKMSTRETGKVCKSFNSAFGGYGEPRKRLQKLLKEFFSELRKAGFGIFAIAHTKTKSIKEKGDDSEGYTTLTSDLSNDTEGIFGDIFDCVLTGYIDRSVEDGKVTAETRKLYFRGNGFVDAGCRFASDTVPEYIVFDKPNMAKDFIKVLEDGLKNSRINKVTDKEFKAQQKEEVEELRTRKVETDKSPQIDESAIKEEKLNKIKSSLSKINMTQLQSIMGKHGIANFNDPTVIPIEVLDEILTLI